MLGGKIQVKKSWAGPKQHETKKVIWKWVLGLIKNLPRKTQRDKTLAGKKSTLRTTCLFIPSVGLQTNQGGMFKLLIMPTQTAKYSSNVLVEQLSLGPCNWTSWYGPKLPQVQAAPPQLQALQLLPLQVPSNLLHDHIIPSLLKRICPQIWFICKKRRKISNIKT
ncbi:unnamed protein product [Microthlaspi erraticum]|uniref:Uncharacterized protein n=1 Tax=Microthlaspi erraticum TaxID=1685480 RepID=A0A6D2KQW3_9BRAS|nr:unnamed protein product [Microthlaspi erraticum]